MDTSDRSTQSHIRANTTDEDRAIAASLVARRLIADEGRWPELVAVVAEAWPEAFAEQLGRTVASRQQAEERRAAPRPAQDPREARREAWAARWASEGAPAVERFWEAFPATLGRGVPAEGGAAIWFHPQSGAEGLGASSLEALRDACRRRIEVWAEVFQDGELGDHELTPETWCRCLADEGGPITVDGDPRLVALLFVELRHSPGLEAVRWSSARAA